MTPTATVTYQTPDKVERALRFTFGARKRIAEMFGMPSFPAILNQFGEGALPALAFAMMYDKDGNPPEGLDLKRFEEALDDPEDGIKLQAAIMSAMTKGAKTKNELEAALREIRDQGIANLIGSLSGASRGDVSGSATPNSGGLPNESSTPSSSTGSPSEESAAIAPA